MIIAETQSDSDYLQIDFELWLVSQNDVSCKDETLIQTPHSPAIATLISHNTDADTALISYNTDADTISHTTFVMNATKQSLSVTHRQCSLNSYES
jgi:hypothetical protein